MNDEADNSRFVSMHVYMHLVFKELICMHAKLVYVYQVLTPFAIYSIVAAMAL